MDEFEPEQITLFEYQNQKQDAKQEKLNKALDEIRGKYGEGIITRGTLLK